MATSILATKLYIPALQTQHVPRPTLLQRLNEGRQAGRKLSLVAAPAGFGKSTLLSEWVAQSQCPAAWLSLDEHDNDLARFLTYLAAALRSINPDIGAEALELLQARQPLPPDFILTTLINDIANTTQRAILVLDDYHLIETQPVHAALTFLLEHLPRQVHLAIASRADLPLPLARMRARGALTELRAADMRFTPEESARFINQAMGADLTSEFVAALESRTEGWIAGLQLAAISMRGREDVAGFVQAFAGSHRYIFDYLVEEVLQGQSEHIRDFLLQTAILDRLSGPLCEAVTGQTEGSAMLRSLERANLFVVPLDDQRQWFRYHHLFADVLRQRLRETQPELINVLHLRASDWYARHDLPNDAIRHALAAKAFERAADLIEMAWPILRQSRQDATLRGWLKTLPDALIRRRPVLSVFYAWALLVAGELNAVEPHLQNAERLLDLPAGCTAALEAQPHERKVANDAEFQTLPITIAVYRAALAQAQGDTTGTALHARKALDNVQADDHLGRGAAGGLLGLAYWAGGDLADAQRTFAEAAASLHRAGNTADAISSAIVLADMHVARGQLRAASDILNQTWQLATAQPEPVPQATADLLVALSALYCEHNDLAAAEQALLQSNTLGARAGLPENRYRWHVAMARITLARGDFRGAHEQLNLAERLYLRGFFPDVRPIAALRARIWIAQGQLAEARGWAKAHKLACTDEPRYLREFEHLTLARLLIAQFRSGAEEGAVRDALALLAHLLQAAEFAARAGSVIEILTVQALAHAAQKDHPRALASLERVLGMAEPEGYVRLFADEGQPMAQLLAAVAARANTQGYAHQLRDACGRPADLLPAEQPLVDPLSARELEVLGLLRTELSGPEISQKLRVSLNTFHTHTKNIYGKLGVNTRQAAVRRAEALNIA